MAIPFLPGIPPLRETLKRTVLSTGLVLLRDYFVSPANQVWGIFTNEGKQVLFPDSFLAIDKRENWRVSDYPIEGGGFSSYNKVATPYGSVITLAKGGSQDERNEFRKTLTQLCASLDLFKIITPDDIFLNANIEAVGYARRADQGANVIIVDITFREIRNAPSIRYSQTRNGSQISSTVPADQKTNSTTSTGIASPTATATPSAQATANNGAVAAVSVPGETGAVQ